MSVKSYQTPEILVTRISVSTWTDVVSVSSEGILGKTDPYLIDSY